MSMEQRRRPLRVRNARFMHLLHLGRSRLRRAKRVEGAFERRSGELGAIHTGQRVPKSLAACVQAGPCSQGVGARGRAGIRCREVMPDERLGRGTMNECTDGAAAAALAIPRDGFRLQRRAMEQSARHDSHDGHAHQHAPRRISLPTRLPWYQSSTNLLPIFYS